MSATRWNHIIEWSKELEANISRFEEAVNGDWVDAQDHLTGVRAAEAKVAALEAENDRLKAETTEQSAKQVCRMCRDGYPVKHYPGGWFHDTLNEPSIYGSWPFGCNAGAIRTAAQQPIPAQDSALATSIAQTAEWTAQANQLTVANDEKAGRIIQLQEQVRLLREALFRDARAALAQREPTPTQ